eukprot:TRINITY_DN59717_c0_g1_i1.p1 TRINITY_DN59717_c0_g1~~TRINITY_DN59717_c0_g1_i1.p1  ORF type:complete len:194 (+),score=78.81 TRINITY_DN59717_c0_g1_i1:41-622(+)
MSRVIPPTNFGVVEDGLYRSGLPTELNYPFLETLRLRTIVYLAPEEPPEHLAHFAADEDVRLMHLGASSAKSPWKPVSEDLVLAALDVLTDSRRYPLLVCCHLGRHRTGTVVGCLRKLQRWNLASIFDEYRRYAAGKVKGMNEQFVELFDTDLVRVSGDVPEHIAVALAPSVASKASNSQAASKATLTSPDAL